MRSISARKVEAVAEAKFRRDLRHAGPLRQTLAGDGQTQGTDMAGETGTKESGEAVRDE